MLRGQSADPNYRIKGNPGECPVCQMKLHRGTKYCSIKCFGISRRNDPLVSKKDRRATKKNSREKTESTCSVCGCIFAVSVDAIRSGLGKLCRRCITVKAGKRARELCPINGERNINWKGGITYDYKSWLSKWVREYRLKNPLKHGARDAVKSALQKGILVKGDCSKCGSKSEVQGHHHKGYEEENWLNVIWLCRTCHNKEHGKLGGINKEGVLQF